MKFFDEIYRLLKMLINGEENDWHNNIDNDDNRSSLAIAEVDKMIFALEH